MREQPLLKKVLRNVLVMCVAECRADLRETDSTRMTEEGEVASEYERRIR